MRGARSAGPVSAGGVEHHGGELLAVAAVGGDRGQHGHAGVLQHGAQRRRAAGPRPPSRRPPGPGSSGCPGS